MTTGVHVVPYSFESLILWLQPFCGEMEIIPSSFTLTEGNGLFFFFKGWVLE